MIIKSLMGDSRHFKVPDAVTQFLRTTENTSLTTYWLVTPFHTNSGERQFLNVSFRNSLIWLQRENVFLKTLSTTVLALEAMPITILAYYYQLHLKESFDKKKTDHESLDVWWLEEILVSGIERILRSLLMNFLQMSNVSKINWYLHSKSKSSNCLTIRILKLYIIMCHLGKDFHYSLK